MKKIIFLLSLVILVTGCTVEKMEYDDVSQLVDNTLAKTHNGANVNFEGYKFYLPRNMNITDKSDYNMTITQGDLEYYLYVDVISYYHRSTPHYEENKDAYYSRVLEDGDKYGYVEINEINRKYFVEIMYNYAKIETYTEERYLEDVIINSFYILSSMNFNDEVLNTLIGENVLNYQEEVLDILGSRRENGQFLDYLKEYDKYDQEGETEEDDLIDEDILLPTEE